PPAGPAASWQPGAPHRAPHAATEAPATGAAWPAPGPAPADPPGAPSGGWFTPRARASGGEAERDRPGGEATSVVFARPRPAGALEPGPSASIPAAAVETVSIERLGPDGRPIGRGGKNKPSGAGTGPERDAEADAKGEGANGDTKGEDGRRRGRRTGRHAKP